MRLGLGTVQFGTDYGIANTDGQTPPAEVRRILELAARHGMQVLDTAAAYGNSETVLGELLPANHAFNIVTKTLPLPVDAVSPADVGRLRDRFDTSWRLLGQTTLYGLLVHHAENLLAPGGEAVWKVLSDLKAAGRVGKIGVSVYTVAQLETLLARYPLELVQLPMNVFDQRFQTAGLLDRLQRQGIEVHVRSVFLQGLLLMPPERLPVSFAPLLPHLTAYHQAVADSGATPIAAALHGIAAVDAITAAVVGVDTAAQLGDLLKASATPPPNLDWKAFALTDERWLLPSRWQLS